MNILYLEDSELDVRLVRQYMDSVQHRLVAVGTIDEAWTYLQSHPVDLFMVDIIIGSDLAYDLIEQVAASQLVPHIVAVTAKALPNERQYCLDLGCSWVIAKPFTVDELEQVLAHFQ